MEASELARVRESAGEGQGNAAMGGVACEVIGRGSEINLWGPVWADEHREARPLNIGGLRQGAPKIAEVRRKSRVLGRKWTEQAFEEE